MNKPSKWAHVIKAWADGVPCQHRCTGGTWYDLSGAGALGNQPSWLEVEGHEYRIKPKTLRYRVALFRDPEGRCWTWVAETEEHAERITRAEPFFRWATDWVEVEV